MIVSDSTTLIILFDMNRVELLYNLFQKIYLPRSVYDEINFKNELKLPHYMEVVSLQESELLHSLNLLLDRGESKAIALAKERGLPLIIDEKKGRKIAQNMDIRIIGLLGIIYLNIKKDLITREEAQLFLDTAITKGYRIHQKLIHDMFQSL
ncbi:MAG: hypothetical protein U9N52_10615 [Campylobacterota bacterium]|nr:hypothetical protein [Campylobacterota bacterium]